MIKNTFYLIIAHVIIISCYLILGLIIPVLLRIEMPVMFLFTWIIAPLITVMIAACFLKSLKVNKSRIYIALSFSLNLSCTLIYTWIESRQPRIEGDFMDFRGLVFLTIGVGQIVGIIFSLIFEKKLNKRLY